MITDESGAEVERRSYDAFGARRNPKWGQAPPAAFASATARGFTWHEQDEELGLVNMKGRIYDPNIRRFLTPDPLVSMPWFGQSWNAYSYVLNNPLAYTDPSGFEPEGEWRVSVIVVDGYPGWSKEWVPAEQDPKKNSQEEAAREAIQTMTQAPPVDVGTTGNTVGFVPQSSPTAPERSTFDNRIGEVALGAAIGFGKLLLGAAKFALLNAVTLGGYGTYSLGKALWAGYKEDGLLGAVNALNPLYAIARGGADTYLAADRGDYRAAGEAGATAAVLGAAIVAGAGSAASAVEEGTLAREAAAAEAAEAPASTAYNPALAELPPYSGGKASGVLHMPGSNPLSLQSGVAGPSQAIRGQGLPGFNGNQLMHVEGHAAAHMRTSGVTQAVLDINRVPCGAGPGGGCAGLLPKMLPEGASLTVRGPSGYIKTFIGLPDP